MKSIQSEQFNTAIAENQEEYTTLYANIDTNHPMCPVTVCFELSDADIEQILLHRKLYYQQCIFRANIAGEGEKPQYMPANLVHPMSISFENPVIDYPEGYEPE